MAQTLTQIKQLLAENGLHPKKRFGQNFLHDHNQLGKILAAAQIQPGEQILEVGPGTGALTTLMLEAGAKVLAVEIDRDLEPVLRQQFDTHENFTLLMGDVLAGKHELNPELLAEVGEQPFKLIANLPYNVASPLLINLLKCCPAMSLVIVMVQKEVAERLWAKPGSKIYGPLTVLAQAACEVEKVTVLGPGCFWPAPSIDSAVVQLIRKPAADQVDLEKLGAFCQTLFQKRRKQLGAILGREINWPEGIDPQMRPEMLSVEQIVALSGV